MQLQKASRPATDSVNEPRRSAGEQDRQAIANFKPNQAARRLIPAARRQIEIVHRYRGIGAQNWTIVLNDGASRKIVSTFTSKREAIEQLGFFSKELRAKIVGRGSAVSR